MCHGRWNYTKSNVISVKEALHKITMNGYTYSNGNGGGFGPGLGRHWWHI